MRIHLNTFVYFVCFVVEMRFLGLTKNPLALQGREGKYA
jgi:hypothetical protein